MFPIRDHNPSEKTPFVTYALMVLNIAVFVSYWQLLDSELALNRFYYAWAMTPERVSGGDQIYTLVTSMFLHAGFLHLAGNMLFLWIFGDNLEDVLGHGRYLLFYLASGIAAGLAQMLVSPGSMVPMVGASGAIAGIMGAYLLLFPKARVDVLFIFIIFFKVIPIPAWIMLGVWFAIQLFSGVGTEANAGGTAYWAHTGGFLFGLLFVLPVWLRRGGPRSWQNSQGAPPHPEAKYKFNPSAIPRIGRRR